MVIRDSSKFLLSWGIAIAGCFSEKKGEALIRETLQYHQHCPSFQCGELKCVMINNSRYYL